MAARANWKGYLKLSLVSCAVALYPAVSSSARIRFNTLNRQTGHRVKRQFVDAETGELVEDDDQVKGYQVGKGAYVVVEDEELDAVKLESTHSIDVESFVPRAEIDERYFDTPYYVAPDDKIAQDAFAVIRDAIREKGMAAIARVVIARRERILMLEPLGKGLLGITLRYPYEVRDEASYFDDIPDIDLPAEMKDLAAHIVERKQTHFDPARFVDRYEEAVVALVRTKQTGEPVKPAAAPKRPSNVVNLIDALRRSIDAEKGGAAKQAKTARRKPPKPSRKPSSARTKGMRKAG